jgi:TatA/E family protein of Tat protein translocase
VPSIGFGEILVILLLGLIIFGPKRLPEMGRTVGRSLREFRRAAADLRAEIESDVDDGPPKVPSPAEQPEHPEPSEPPAMPKPGEVPPT